MVPQHLLVSTKKQGMLYFALITLITFFSSYPNITGHATASLYKQQIDMIFTPEGLCAITLDTNKTITSLRINGEIIGTGLVQLTLQDYRGKKITVFRNLRSRTNSRTQLITSQTYAVDAIQLDAMQESGKMLMKRTKKCHNRMPTELPENYETYSGHVHDACENSCNIPTHLLQPGEYALQITIEKDTQMRLDTITYTLE